MRRRLPRCVAEEPRVSLLPGRVFDFPPHGTLNIHASLLPKYRGAAPIARALLNGEGVTGVTLMRIEERLDSGPILGLEEIPVALDATTGETEDLLAVRGASLLLRLLSPYVDGQLDPRRQDESGVSYAPMIHKAEIFRSLLSSIIIIGYIPPRISRHLSPRQKKLSNKCIFPLTNII